jgi:16S rRNA processing protein RimM
MSHVYYHVGKIVNTQGIRGEVKIVPQTDFPEVRFAKGSQLYAYAPDSSVGEPLTVEASRSQKGSYIVKFKEYNNINEVLRLKGGALKVHEEDLVELEEEEYYYHEIMGCEVYSEEGEKLGVIKEILSPSANDVWVAKREKGKDLLIPVIDDVVREVDISRKRITIHVMEGLLDL